VQGSGIVVVVAWAEQLIRGGARTADPQSGNWIDVLTLTRVSVRVTARVTVKLGVGGEFGPNPGLQMCSKKHLQVAPLRDGHQPRRCHRLLQQAAR